MRPKSSTALSFGGLRQEKGPFLRHQILWGHVMEVDITVGEQYETGYVQTPSVGGEGTFVEMFALLAMTVVSEIGRSPPFAPTKINISKCKATNTKSFKLKVRSASANG